MRPDPCLIHSPWNMWEMQETNPAPAGRTLIAERLPLTSTTFRATGCSTTRSRMSAWIMIGQDNNKHSAHRTTGKLLDFPYLSLSTITIYHYLSLSFNKLIPLDIHRKTMENPMFSSHPLVPAADKSFASRTSVASCNTRRPAAESKTSRSSQVFYGFLQLS